MFSLEPLQLSHFRTYFSSFSRVVQTALHITDLASEHHYLQSCCEKQKDGNTSFYVIVQDEKSCAGAIEIRHVDSGAGQLYCWVAQDFWGTGLFANALKRAVNNYFEKTNALFFTAHVDIGNQRSWRALQKFGFAHFGIVMGPRGNQYKLILLSKFLIR